MKRFLSILLASMMILGCMAVTVSADAPTLTLDITNTLANIATNKTVAAGRYVAVNAVADATYYRNGEVIAPKAGLKANTVALPVVAGTNAFQAEVAGVKSAPLYIYGIALTNKAGEELQASDPTLDLGSKSTSYYATVSADQLTALHGADLAATITDGRSDITYSKSSSGGQSGGVLDSNAFTKGYEAIEYKTDAFYPSNPNTSTQQALRLYNGSYTNAVIVNTNGTVNIAGTSSANGAGVSIATGTWQNFAVVVYKETGAFDVYKDDILIGKNMGSGFSNGTSVASNKKSTNATETNPEYPYYDNTLYSKHVLVAEPTFTATPDAAANTITVEAANLSEGVSVNVYKDDVKVGTVALTDGAGTYTVTETGSYVVKAEDANGTVQINRAGTLLQSAATAFTVEGGEEPGDEGDVFNGAVTAEVNSGGVGVVTFDDTLLEDDEASIIIVKNDGTIERKVYTKGEDETTQTFTSVKKLFVWKWGTMVPLCYAAVKN